MDEKDRRRIQSLVERRDIDGLIASLTNTDMDVRTRVAEALGDIGDERAVEPLITALNDTTDYPVFEVPLQIACTPIDARVEAALALGKIGSKASAEALQAIADTSVEKGTREGLSVGEAVAKALAELGGVDHEYPNSAVMTSSEVTAAPKSEEVAKKTATIRDNPVEWFIDELKERISWYADVSKVLVRIGDSYAMEALIAALNNEDPKVRKLAILAVDSMNNSRFLLSVGSSRIDPETAPDIQAPVTLEDDRVIKALTVALNDDETDTDTRKGVVGALGSLGQMGVSSTVEPLITALNDNAWSVQFDAASGLVNIYRDNKVDETHLHLILAQEATIRNVLPDDRIRYLRNQGIWPFD